MAPNSEWRRKLRATAGPACLALSSVFTCADAGASVAVQFSYSGGLDNNPSYATTGSGQITLGDGVSVGSWADVLDFSLLLQGKTGGRYDEHHYGLAELTSMSAALNAVNELTGLALSTRFFYGGTTWIFPQSFYANSLDARGAG